MFAVMTMNVGYLLSVLAGTWIETFFLGSVSPTVGNELQHF